MRAKDYADLTDDELDHRLADTRQELFNLRFQAATGQLDNHDWSGRTTGDLHADRLCKRGNTFAIVPAAHDNECITSSLQDDSSCSRTFVEECRNGETGGNR